MTPAEELQQAATKIVELFNFDHNIPTWDIVGECVQSGLNERGYDRGKEHGAHVALWSPGMAVLVASMLEDVADDMNDEGAHEVELRNRLGSTYKALRALGGTHNSWDAALTLARAINGSAS